MRTKYKFIVLITLACLCSIGIYNICEKPKSVNVEPGLVALQRDYEKDFSDSKKYTSEEPLVVLNPYGISPLTALIIFETPDLTTPGVTIVGKDSSTTIKNTFKPGKVHYLPVYGLYPDKENEVILTVNGVSKTIKIQTEKLPENFDLPTTVEADRASLKNELYFVTPASTGDRKSVV